MSSGRLTVEEVIDRLAARDTTLWPKAGGATGHLGFLTAARNLERDRRNVERWAAGVDEDTVVLLGVGGALAVPRALSAVAQSFSKPDGRRLVVCDTTDPTTVAAAPLEGSLVVIVSKSGTTLETEALFEHARGRIRDLKRFVVVTDPGTPLASRAEELRVGRLALSAPDLPASFSAFGPLGGLCAALAGYDLEEYCGRALEIDRRDAVELGLELGTAALEGHEKATIVTAPGHAAIGEVVAGLLAATTGKAGRGCVPIPVTAAESAPDRHEVEIELGFAHELGALFERFAYAAVAAAHVLQVDPFDDRGITDAKAATSAILASTEPPRPGAHDADALAPFLAEELRDGDYVAISAFLPHDAERQERLERLRQQLRDAHGGLAVTAGYGTAVHHTTGQLHVEGPASAIVVQLVPRTAAAPVPVPGKPYDLATLTDAQAVADYERLVGAHRRVLRIAVDDPAELY